jgi:hypothetical protein
MPLPHPMRFHPQLDDQKLHRVSSWLLEELYATDDNLSRFTDSAYGRGCTAFDRQKNRIILEHASGEHPWLNVSANTFDLVFSIEGIPCRFSSDYAQHPTKKAVVEVSRYQKTFFDDVVSPGAPARFCFVIDRGSVGGDEARVVFMGMDSDNVIRCEWLSDDIRAMHLAGSATPAAVDVGKPAIGIKQQRDQQLGHSKAAGR